MFPNLTASEGLAGAMAQCDRKKALGSWAWWRCPLCAGNSPFPLYLVQNTLCLWPVKLHPSSEQCPSPALGNAQTVFLERSFLVSGKHFLPYPQTPTPPQPRPQRTPCPWLRGRPKGCLTPASRKHLVSDFRGLFLTNVGKALCKTKKLCLACSRCLINVCGMKEWSWEIFANCSAQHDPQILFLL